MTMQAQREADLMAENWMPGRTTLMLRAALECAGDGATGEVFVVGSTRRHAMQLLVRLGEEALLQKRHVWKGTAASLVIDGTRFTCIHVNQAHGMTIGKPDVPVFFCPTALAEAATAEGASVRSALEAVQHRSQARRQRRLKARGQA